VPQANEMTTVIKNGYKLKIPAEVEENKGSLTDRDNRSKKDIDI